MSQLIIPKDYKPAIDFMESQRAIKKIKDYFQQELAYGLNLRRVSAPLFVLPESGLNDNLNGTERRVNFTLKDMDEKEVEVVKRVLQYLKNSQGFEEYFNHWEKIKNEDKRLQEQEIGIISFYGHQVKKLQDVKRYAQKDLQIPIRLKTVDKFQGMERNIIIVSTVRSSKIIKGGLEEKNSDIGFAKAPERLNVALSRARRLLIVVGNLKFFESYKDKSGNAIYKNAIDIIRKEGLVIEDYKKLNKYK